MSPNELDIRLYPSVESAPKYTAPEFRPAQLEHACIVRNGTEGGRSTIDLIFVDANGQKYIAMSTGRLIRALAAEAGDEQ